MSNKLNNQLLCVCHAGIYIVVLWIYIVVFEKMGFI